MVLTEGLCLHTFDTCVRKYFTRSANVLPRSFQGRSCLCRTDNRAAVTARHCARRCVPFSERVEEQANDVVGPDLVLKDLSASHVRTDIGDGHARSMHSGVHTQTHKRLAPCLKAWLRERHADAGCFGPSCLLLASATSSRHPSETYSHFTS